MDFAVRTTDVRFLEVLRRYLGRYLTEDGPEDILFSCDGGVQKTLPGGKTTKPKRRLYFQAILIYGGTVMEEMAGRLISGVRDWTNNQSNEYLRVRAGGVVLDGRTLLLPSAPEPHLASLVAALVQDGAGYVGDEIVNLDPVLHRVHGTGLPLLLDAQDSASFPELGTSPSRPGRGPNAPRQLWPVPVEDLGGSIADPAEPGWIVFPRFDPQARTEFRPLGKAEAVFRFAQAGLNTHIWGDRALLLMTELLDGAHTGELIVGDIRDAARWLQGSLPRSVDA
jgi:hypothetical protein